MTGYGQENRVEKPQQRVVCAACKHPKYPFIVAGPRHWDDVMLRQWRIFVEVFPTSGGTGRWEQGFIDQFGDFLTREEAMQVAKAAGQVNIERNGSKIELYSEGLY